MGCPTKKEYEEAMKSVIYLKILSQWRMNVGKV